MIEKNVVIFVRGEQTYDGADPDATELISEGTMSIDDGGAVTVTYQETELTGMEGTTTRFTIQGDSVVLTRTGSVNSQMVFQKGVRHSSLYETPYGALTVDVSTLRLAHRLGERGGRAGGGLHRGRGAPAGQPQPIQDPHPGEYAVNER